MSALLISLLQIIIPAVIKYGPEAIAQVKELLDKQEPTADDWEKLRKYAPPYESFEIPTK